MPSLRLMISLMLYLSADQRGSLAFRKCFKKHLKKDTLCKTINPDEAVAYGAAVQGAIYRVIVMLRHSSFCWWM